MLVFVWVMDMELFEVQGCLSVRKRSGNSCFGILTVTCFILLSKCRNQGKASTETLGAVELHDSLVDSSPPYPLARLVQKAVVERAQVWTGDGCLLRVFLRKRVDLHTGGRHHRHSDQSRIVQFCVNRRSTTLMVKTKLTPSFGRCLVWHCHY